MAKEINIAFLQNRELGESIRGKLNQVIDVLNNAEDFLPEGPPGPEGPRGPTGPDLTVQLNIIGFSDTTDDLPSTADVGDGWLVVGNDQVDSDFQPKVYIWSNDQWNFAFEFTLPFDESTQNLVFVKKNGDDGNRGDNLGNAVATIKRATEILATLDEPGAAYVYPGIYEEEGDIEIPENCGIVSVAGQYTTEIHATNAARDAFKNMILLNSGSYVQGFTFRNQVIDDLDDPTGGFAVAWAPGARIVRSPYVRDIAQVSNFFGNSVVAPLDPNNGNPLVGNGGGVALADRAVLDRDSIYPSLLLFAATPRSPNGLGYVAKNGAFVNGISSITIFQRTAFYAINGGQITLNNSGTQFGDISMRAKGSMQVVDPVETSASLVISNDVADAINSNQTNLISDMWSTVVGQFGSGVNNQETEDLFKLKAGRLIDSIEFDFRGGTQKVTQSFVLNQFDYEAEYVFDAALLDEFVFAYQYIRDAIKSIITSIGFDPTLEAAYTAMVDGLIDDCVVDTLENKDDYLLTFGSLIESLGHQFNNAGAGVNTNALPLNLRRPGENLTVPFTVLEEDGGRVRWSGADELNNQYFAGGTRINGLTGRLEGRPFNSAVRQIARRVANSRGII